MTQGLVNHIVNHGLHNLGGDYSSASEDRIFAVMISMNTG